MQSTIDSSRLYDRKCTYCTSTDIRPTAEGQALREGRLADVSNFNFSDAEGTSLVSQATRADASKAFTVAKKEMKQMHASLKQRWA